MKIMKSRLKQIIREEIINKHHKQQLDELYDNGYTTVGEPATGDNESEESEEDLEPELQELGMKIAKLVADFLKGDSEEDAPESEEAGEEESFELEDNDEDEEEESEEDDDE